MADCECLNGCLFFNDQMKSMGSIKQMMKKRLCQGDNRTCARHMVFKALGKPHVPPDLFPNEIDRAAALIVGG
jgi:hypothetical protein